MIEPIKFFTDKFNITILQIESLLGAALSKGGEYADLYFEYNVLSNLGMEEQIIKSANRAVRQGVGVRVISG
ncbi:MAG: DNA gyrase modulator, partial [Blastocatellia bacterium]